MRQFDGTPARADTLALLCYNSPWRECFAAYLRELIALGVDGFFFDSNDHFPTVCYCEHCAARFHDRYGADLPAAVDWDSLTWRQFVRFREQSILEFLEYQRDVVCAAGRDLPIVVNWFMCFNDWRCGQNDEGARLDGVYPMMETHLAGGDASLAELFGPHWSPAALRTFILQRQRAAAGGKTIVGWASHATQLAGQNSQAGSAALAAPDAERQLRFRTMIANGAIPEIASPRYGTEARTIAEIAEREPWLLHTRPYGWAGLLASNTNRNFMPRSSREDTSAPLRQWRLEENGFFQACLDAHLPLRLVTDLDLEAGTFDDLAVLVLPNSVCLSDTAADRIRAFVRGGGGLIATGETGRLDEWGRSRPASALADVLGVEFDGRTEFRRACTKNPFWGGVLDPHCQRIAFPPATTELGAGLALRDRPDPFYRPGGGPEVQPSYALSWSGPLPVVRARDGADVSSELEYENPEGDALLRSPAVVSRRFGQGRTVYTAFPLGRMDQKTGDAYVRRFLLNALRAVASRLPDVEGVGPGGVVMVVNEQPHEGRLVIHLINEIPPRGRPPLISRPRETHLLVDGFELVIRNRTVRRALLVPEGVELTPRSAEKETRISLPPLAVHAMVSIE